MKKKRKMKYEYGLEDYYRQMMNNCTTVGPYRALPTVVKVLGSESDWPPLALDVYNVLGEIVWAMGHD